ncbi:hypothetical protein M752DRAFT_167112 [Aspergillus phoenicis ATCC 13157]|uniref:Uncharacterized protein n=1 Tax=Aspergillus phoenicis ATCC 13157 TaxID=1353007 RepID=A0A370PLM2_ASPPH|nr:hypothetical protein M752DRAFT_167112 [Aspergillus phoenicis ATCC 13157]
MRFLRFVCSFPPTQSGLFPPLFSSPLRAHLNLIFLFPHLPIFIRFLFVNLVLLPAPYSHTLSLFGFPGKWFRFAPSHPC